MVTLILLTHPLHVLLLVALLREELDHLMYCNPLRLLLNFRLFFLHLNISLMNIKPLCFIFLIKFYCKSFQTAGLYRKYKNWVSNCVMECSSLRWIKNYQWLDSLPDFPCVNSFIIQLIFNAHCDLDDQMLEVREEY